MKKTFCDRCDQQLIEPDENVNFLGNGALTTGDVCWPCRLVEVVDAYNAKVEEEPERPKAKLTFVPNRKGATATMNFSDPDFSAGAVALHPELLTELKSKLVASHAES